MDNGYAAAATATASNRPKDMQMMTLAATITAPRALRTTQCEVATVRGVRRAGRSRRRSTQPDHVGE